MTRFSKAKCPLRDLLLCFESEKVRKLGFPGISQATVGLELAADL